MRNRPKNRDRGKKTKNKKRSESTWYSVWNTVSKSVNDIIIAVSVLSHYSRLQYHTSISYFLSNTFSWRIPRHFKFNIFRKQTHHFSSLNLPLLFPSQPKVRTLGHPFHLLIPQLPHSPNYYLKILTVYVPIFTFPFL